MRANAPTSASSPPNGVTARSSSSSRSCMYIRPLDLTQPNIYISPQVEAMLGYPAEEWLTDANLVERVVHPDDRERVLGEAARVRGGGRPVHDEYRYLKSDGSVVWVQDETHLVLDERRRAALRPGLPAGHHRAKARPRRSATGCATSSCTRSGSSRSAASPAASRTTSTTC